MPTAIPAVVVQATLGMAGAIIAEASLSFLGLGVQPPTPSWGTMLDAGRAHLLDAPHLTIFPGLAIALLVLGFNFLGDGLRDRVDPKTGTVMHGSSESGPERAASASAIRADPCSSALLNASRSAASGSPACELRLRQADEERRVRAGASIAR